MAASPVVAVVAAGAMGSAIGRKLVQNGCTVLTNLDGRSDATRSRAIEAGMKDVSYSEIWTNANYVLSIIPPSDAISFAETFLQASKESTRAGKDSLLFADCNAVNPNTLQSIAKLFSSSSTSFIDASIIGGPPSGDYNPVVYASAEDTNVLERFRHLSNYGLNISPITGGSLGDASALKMSYAGITKGITGLFTTMILAAHASSPSTSDALMQELSASQPELLKRITRTIPPMIPKAYRFSGEMQEIGEFVGGGAQDVYKGISSTYERVEQSLKGDGKDVEVLRKFVEDAKK